MKIKVLKSFSLKLADQVEFIAEDKPLAARKFKTDILKAIKELEISLESRFISMMKISGILFSRDIQLFTRSSQKKAVLKFLDC